MKTALAAPCFLDGMDAQGNDRLVRNIRYVRYYTAIRGVLGFDSIHLFDNNSSSSRIWELHHATRNTDLSVHSFSSHLMRGPKPHDYPYCWRALYALQDLIARGYEKIIFIDSDAFVLSRVFAEFLRDCKTGWQAPWCPLLNTPETSIFVLCEDTYPLFQNYTKRPWENRVGDLMEGSLPITHVRKEFNVQRFGEMNPPPPQDPTMDAYLQTPLTMPLLEFEKEKYDS